MSSMSSHAEKLKQIRKAEGLTQASFAQAVGVALSTVKNYERGDKVVGLSIIDKVTNNQTFKKYTLWLMTGDTHPESGQISPTLSPDGQESISSRQNGKQAG